MDFSGNYICVIPKAVFCKISKRFVWFLDILVVSLVHSQVLRLKNTVHEGRSISPVGFKTAGLWNGFIALVRASREGQVHCPEADRIQGRKGKIYAHSQVVILKFMLNSSQYFNQFVLTAVVMSGFIVFLTHYHKATYLREAWFWSGHATWPFSYWITMFCGYMPC